MTGPETEGASLPRLLAGISADGPLTLHGHVSTHGERPAVRGPNRATLVAEVQRAGLTGRGGGGFPLAAKLQAVAASGGGAVVVANGSESEPASVKDRTLLEALPHLVLDGAALAAEAVGADEAIVGVSESAPGALRALGHAIEERRGIEAVRFTLISAPARYVAGQETALVNLINGGPSLPTFTPPRPFERGVRRLPTLVANVETLAHLALVARHGARWFRRLGTTNHPGSLLVTLTGPVLHPGVYEIESGASLSSLVAAAGGATGSVRALLLGGYAGTWIDGGLTGGVALSDEHLAPHGASVGAGLVTLLSSDACPAREVARVARWLADQSAHQCGPCIHGLDELARTLEGIVAGAAGRKPAERIAHLCSLAEGRGACAHPDGSVRFVRSAIEVFPEELADHAQHGPCEACAGAPELPLPPASRLAADGERRQRGRTPRRSAERALVNR